MEKPHLTILSCNLSGNRLGRALVFADCLKDDFNIRIVGMLRHKAAIWKAAQEYSASEIISVTLLPFPFYLISVISALRKIKGRVVIAVKPLFSSFGIGLLAKLLLGKKLIIDIDDNEISLLSSGKSFRKKYLTLNPDKLPMSLLLQNLISQADHITISNSALKVKYGGTIIPHVRDPKFLQPPDSKENLKRRLGLDDKCFIIGHIGSYRPHKGVERIIEAINILNDPNLIFLYTSNKDQFPPADNVKRIDEFPFSQLPFILGACDLTVFPLDDSEISRYQLPAKLIDAMMMEIPFIASKTDALASLIVDDKMLIENSGDSNILAKRIKYIQDNPEIMREKTKRFRQFAENHLSISSASKILHKIIDSQ